ncbi:gamma-aminobutyric acid receptor alpha-like [Patella vulgata]|uniref:gamma-aminobutyric acid receptor alpha-like n=1 Tax=Patella vulgata TaxID=6465 RepID=UPI0024A8C332|nr:gamma-aminobutyric acid receptor alpha-like [Patella vulgata]
MVVAITDFIFYLISFIVVTYANNKSDDTTALLDRILQGYDKRLRPGFGGLPTTVKTDIMVRSMGPISEKKMIYSMDCYFRQYWIDKRLSFNASVEPINQVTLNVKMLNKIWAPDTVFLNGGHSYVHMITSPNKFVRLSANGSVYLSQRLTIKATCPMHLEKFPMDSQKCPLFVASFAYGSNDVSYKWRYGDLKAVSIAGGMTMSQFDLINIEASHFTEFFKGVPHSIVSVNFHLRRHTGYFLIQVYVPCCLLVVLSWVSFWINREATADRIALGTTTVLTMTFLALDSRDDLPRVSYSTALDVYVAMCFLFVFASIVQFAGVHHFTKYGIAEKQEGFAASDDSDDDSEEERYIHEERINVQRTDSVAKHGFCYMCVQCLGKFLKCLLHSRNNKFKRHVRNALGLNSVSKIDKVSRVLFPMAFTTLNIVYWVSYLTH